MPHRPSTATLVAFLALVVALGGTAAAEPVVNAAARLVTGKGVKNGSLTGKDVKNRSLTPADFRGSVRGRRGATGATGSTGPTGPTGAQGVSGVTSVTRLEVQTGFLADTDLEIDPNLVSEAGAFTKGAPGSRIKLTWNGRIRGEGDVGTAWFCDYQLRVDGAAADGEGGRAVVFANDDVARDMSVSITAFFAGLAAGSHQVDVYVRADPATTNRCSTAEGGFEDEVFVEEMPS